VTAHGSYHLVPGRLVVVEGGLYVFGQRSREPDRKVM